MYSQFIHKFSSGLVQNCIVTLTMIFLIIIVPLTRSILVHVYFLTCKAHCLTIFALLGFHPRSPPPPPPPQPAGCRGCSPLRVPLTLQDCMNLNTLIFNVKSKFLYINFNFNCSMFNSPPPPPPTYVHTHTKKCKMQIILLPLSGHAHLAEPGCLCTKQALGACASKLLENGLGTRRRTSYLLTASGVGTRSPT